MEHAVLERAAREVPDHGDAGPAVQLQRELKGKIGAGIAENVKNHALVMEADVSTAAEAIRSYLKQTAKISL
jgi:hypothetical protein